MDTLTKHPSGIVIRRATSEDFQGVKQLQELEFGIHRENRPDYFKPLESSYSQEEYAELLVHPSPICWVAVQGERVVGLCFGTVEKTPENAVCASRLVALIQDVVTWPDCRSQGIATALLAQARKQATSAGAESLELCVWNFNADAIRLYQKLGMNIQYIRMEERLS